MMVGSGLGVGHPEERRLAVKRNMGIAFRVWVNTVWVEG